MLFLAIAKFLSPLWGKLCQFSILQDLSKRWYPEKSEGASALQKERTIEHFGVEARELDVVRNWSPSAHRHATEESKRLSAPQSRVVVSSLTFLPVVQLLCSKLKAPCCPSTLDLSSRKYCTNGDELSQTQVSGAVLDQTLLCPGESSLWLGDGG